MRFVASDVVVYLGYATLVLNYSLDIVALVILIKGLLSIKKVASGHCDVFIVKFYSMCLLVAVYIIYMVTVALMVLSWNYDNLSAEAFLAFNLTYQLVYTTMMLILIFVFYQF